MSEERLYDDLYQAIQSLPVEFEEKEDTAGSIKAWFGLKGKLSLSTLNAVLKKVDPKVQYIPEEVEWRGQDWKIELQSPMVERDEGYGFFLEVYKKGKYGRFARIGYEGPGSQPESSGEEMESVTVKNKNIEIFEDWGSSDMGYAVDEMQRYIDTYCDGVINPETILEAAEHAAAMYSDAMGLAENQRAAEKALIRAYMVRKGFHKMLAPKEPEGTDFGKNEPEDELPTEHSRNDFDRNANEGIIESSSVRDTIKSTLKLFESLEKEPITELKTKHSWTEVPEWYTAYVRLGRGEKVNDATKNQRMRVLRSTNIPFEIMPSEYEGMLKIRVPSGYAKRLDRVLHQIKTEESASDQDHDQDRKNAEKYVDDFVSNAQKWSAARKKKGHDIQGATPDVMQAKPKEAMGETVSSDVVNRAYRTTRANLSHYKHLPVPKRFEIAAKDTVNSSIGNAGADAKTISEVTRRIVDRLKKNSTTESVVAVDFHGNRREHDNNPYTGIKNFERALRKSGTPEKEIEQQLDRYRDLHDMGRPMYEAYSDPSGLWAAEKYAPKDIKVEVMFRAKNVKTIHFNHKKFNVKARDLADARAKVREYFAKKYPNYKIYAINQARNKDED